MGRTTPRMPRCIAPTRGNGHPFRCSSSGMPIGAPRYCAGFSITGWLAEDYFADNQWFKCATRLVVSASSKTAIGFVRCADARAGAEVIGVTSPHGTTPFRASHRLLQRSRVPYEDIAAPARNPIVSIDMAETPRPGAGCRRHGSLRSGQLEVSMAVGRGRRRLRHGQRHSLTRARVSLETTPGKKTSAGLGSAWLPETGDGCAAGFHRLEP